MKFTSSDINSSNTWQIGTGDDTRNYFDVFLRFGVALVGPGNPGPEGHPMTEWFYKTNPGFKNWGKVLAQVQISDWIVARKGKSLILGIGKVISGSSYEQRYGDIEGWDLQHFVKVDWYVPKAKNNQLELVGKYLSQSTLQRIKKLEVFDSIYSSEFERVKKEKDHLSIPEPREYAIDEMAENFIDLGVRIGDVENVIKSIQRIIKLTNWYRRNDYNVLENEIVAFLVLPLIIALGWSEQKIKLEYNNIDLALFKDPFTGDYSQNPEIIIEVKTFTNGLAFTDKQIRAYGRKFKQCLKFITTNGFRYNYYEKKSDELNLKGSFNLTRLVQREYIKQVELNSIDTMIKISNFR